MYDLLVATRRLQIERYIFKQLRFFLEWICWRMELKWSSWATAGCQFSLKIAFQNFKTWPTSLKGLALFCSPIASRFFTPKFIQRLGSASIKVIKIYFPFFRGISKKYRRIWTQDRFVIVISSEVNPKLVQKPTMERFSR